MALQMTSERMEAYVEVIEILKGNNVSDEMIYSIRSHAYGLCSDAKPEKQMEKILFATDELTGLIGAAINTPAKNLNTKIKIGLKLIKPKPN